VALIGNSERNIVFGVKPLNEGGDDNIDNAIWEDLVKSELLSSE
jgi:hypothetical protein